MIELERPPEKPVVLTVSTSAKRSRSATRGLLDLGAEVISRFVTIDAVDLARLPVPIYDGRLPSDHPSDVVRGVLARIEAADAIVIGVPCYWGAPSGTFVNFVNTLCGPAYDMDLPKTVFFGKPVSLVLVGADDYSAEISRTITETMMQKVGAILSAPSIVIANPRKGYADTLSTELAHAFVTVAKVSAHAKSTRG